MATNHPPTATEGHQSLLPEDAFVRVGASLPLSSPRAAAVAAPATGAHS
ncbi:hypothetical protein [Arthrobacter sp. SLBN-83]|nr:hypothetical protein [Arthrobacter sp. SLBN-83]